MSSSSSPSLSPNSLQSTSLESTSLESISRPSALNLSTSLQSTSLESTSRPSTLNLSTSLESISRPSTSRLFTSLESTSPILSNNSSICGEASSFKEKDAFKEIKELGFLSYYKDFKLLLCSKCFLAINSTIFRSHIIKHIKLYTKEKRDSIVFKALVVFNSLEVSSLKESLKLINLFSKSFKLQAFKELKILDLFSCNLSSNCSLVLSSEYSIKRHIRENHSSSNSSPNPSPYRVIKGQALEINKFFFEIKSSNSPSLGNSSRASSRSRSNSPRIDNIERAKEAFIASYSQKEERYLEELSSFKLDPKEKLSPFQIKTRYIEYINKYNIQDLVALGAPLSKEEVVLEVLVLNLKEMLYLSLEKSIFLNKVDLNILNSFEDNKIRNKPFKPLLTSNTRVKYFDFFSRFLVDFFRALSKDLKKEVSYFKVDKSIVTLYTTLINLVDQKIREEEDYLKLSINSLKKNKRLINTKFTKYTLNNLLNQESLDEEETSSTNSLDSSLDSSSSSNSMSSGSSSNSTSSSSSSNSTSSSSSSSSIELSNSNKEILKKIKEINQSKESLSIEIKSTLLDLLIRLLKQRTNLYIFDSCFNSFFATISIKAKDYSFEDSLYLSQSYSKFIYCIQLLVIEYSFRVILDDNSLELTTILRDFRDKYLNNSSNSALSEVLHNRAYCLKVNKERSTLNFISISPTKKETLSYMKITLSVDDLRVLFKELINSTYSLLVEKLLLDIPKSRYKEITLEEYAKVEDRSLTTPFKCFRDLSPNLEVNTNFLKSTILRDSSLFNRFFILKGLDLELNQGQVTKYLKDLLEFKKLCLLLVYLTTGLPLRGTELITLRYLNSYKDKREIFLDISSSLFIVNISYYKGQGLSERQASNIRYLPYSVSRIFLLYIVLVDPFINFLNISLLNTKKLAKTKSLVPYFFFVNSRLLESRDLSLKLNSFSRLILGIKLGIQVYRQIIIAIIKEFMLEELNTETFLLQEEENSLTKLVASQSNHSTRVEDLNYARSSFSFSNIRSNLQYKYLQFCLRYFAYFKLDLIDAQVESYKNQLRIKNSQQREENLNTANSLAIRFSKTIPIEVLDSSSSNIGRKHRRQASSIASTSLRVPKKIKTLDLINLSSLSSTSSILSSLLQEFLQNSSASFRSLEQELLVKSILLKVPYILGVLPTSIGKSLAYLLTSSLSISKVTIVILPLVGVKLNILERASEFNIPCSIFEEALEFKNLTLISIETIVSPTFRGLVQGLISSNSLDRIIIDECHLIISSASYRNIMYRFKELLELPTQFVFLTGTLPYSFEQELISSLYLDELSIIRASCCRPNISYRASIYKSTKGVDQIREIQEYISSFRAKEFLTSEDKVLVFCPSKASIELIAKTLNCSRYHTSLSIEEKASTLRSFTSSKEEYYTILATSSSLQEGFDYSSIRLVVYIDLAYSFLGFLQGSSRGGRDLRPSTSMFFYSSNSSLFTSSTSNSSSTLLEHDKYLVKSYLLETICRRRQISLYLDNQVVEQCSSLDNPCDLCLKRSSTTNRQISRILDSTKLSEEERSKVQEQLISLSSSCIFCNLLLGIVEVDEIRHSSSSCLRFSNLKDIAIKIKELISLKEVILQANSCCFRCLFPTIICSHLSESSQCYNPLLIYQVLALFYTYSKDLELDNDLNLRPRISLKEFLKVLLSKVFIKELNTEAILGFRFLIYDLF